MSKTLTESQIIKRDPVLLLSLAYCSKTVSLYSETYPYCLLKKVLEVAAETDLPLRQRHS